MRAGVLAAGVASFALVAVVGGVTRPHRAGVFLSETETPTPVLTDTPTPDLTSTAEPLPFETSEAPAVPSGTPFFYNRGPLPTYPPGMTDHPTAIPLGTLYPPPLP